MDLFDAIHSEEENRRAESAMALHQAGVQMRRNLAADVANQRTYQAMLDSVKDWQIPELPDLSQFDEVIMDLETTGLRWWAGDRMIGAALWTPDGTTRYLPIRHEVGPNIEPAKFFEWCRRELRGKKVTNIRTKFDLHMLRMDDVNLDEQGCSFGDVAHYAALLYDQRREFSQESLVRDLLLDKSLPPHAVAKMKAANGFNLDPSKFAKYPAGLVAVRGEHDVLMVSYLKHVLWNGMTDQGLHRVRAVEEEVIPMVVEMEHNGAPLDMDLLDRYDRESLRDMNAALDRIYASTGIRPETPDKRDDLIRVFQKLNIAVPEDPETGKPSFADALLAEIKHPTVQDIREAKALFSLRSKFIVKYKLACSRDGILRYELHQLPYEDDTEGGGGAVSGRFSSAAMTYYNEEGTQKKDGGNIQQVMGVKSQYDKKKPDEFWPTKNYIIRYLFKPDKANPGAAWFSADMRQIEYRRFVHYSEAERLIQSYLDDPLTDYHQLVHGLIVKHTGKDFERTHVKNLNFASLYGAGLLKIALMVGEINEAVYLELRNKQKKDPKGVKNDPRISKTRSLYETYHSMFPEVRGLLDLASNLAMPGHSERCRKHGCTKEHRGHVFTILGRRARFRANDRFYSALNRVIQGTAADDNKVALIDVYKERKALGFIPRFTVHDELGGDLLDPASLPKIAEFLNRPRLPSRVPILWDSKVAPSWGEAK